MAIYSAAEAFQLRIAVAVLRELQGGNAVFSVERVARQAGLETQVVLDFCGGSLRTLVMRAHCLYLRRLVQYTVPENYKGTPEAALRTFLYGLEALFENCPEYAIVLMPLPVRSAAHQDNEMGASFCSDYNDIARHIGMLAAHALYRPEVQARDLAHLLLADLINAHVDERETSDSNPVEVFLSWLQPPRP